MTFTVLPDAVDLSDLIDFLKKADPYDGPPLHSDTPEGEVSVRLFWPHVPGNDSFVDAIRAIDAWERKHVRCVYNILTQESGHLILVSDLLPIREVSPNILNHVPVSMLKLGMFNALNYPLDGLKAYENCQIFVPAIIAEKIRCLKDLPSAYGRPPLDAKAWYFERHCCRDGSTMKGLQREFEKVFDKAPSASSIRNWEREFENGAQ
jgi:hypothetical protein